MIPTLHRFVLLLAGALLALSSLSSCTAYRMRAQVRESRTVVLDIGHYCGSNRDSGGARTPDKRYGFIQECAFWYTYAGYVKDVIERAGYRCVITNRGATPREAKLAKQAARLGVIQLNTPDPTQPLRSKHHPKRRAVGMSSVDAALDQKPACVVFLHLNSYSEKWKVWNRGGFYCNQEGERLATRMAAVMDAKILNKGMPNGGEMCRVILRTDGRRGGGGWLNACQDSYVPAVITEVPFLSNPLHAQFLSKSRNAISFAQAIGEGIVSFLNAR